jgi:hypothetical protein
MASNMRELLNANGIVGFAGDATAHSVGLILPL